MIRCRYCNRSGFRWTFSEPATGWRLTTRDGKMHTCDAGTAARNARIASRGGLPDAPEPFYGKDLNRREVASRLSVFDDATRPMHGPEFEFEVRA